MLDLDAIEARADAATKGPWRAGTLEHEGKVWAEDAEALGGPSVGERCLFNANLHYPHTANRVFIAAARADVPALIAEVRRLTAENERIREACVRACSPIPNLEYRTLLEVHDMHVHRLRGVTGLP